MSETYETMNLNGPERNVERLGALTAWLISNHLLDAHLERDQGRKIARVRMQDMTGPEFLTTVLHGDLKATHLNDVGRDFVEAYLKSGRYLDDYARCRYQGENEWHRYDEIGPMITAAFRQHTKPAPTMTARILKFPFGRKK
ncbi:MAG: hypothetical protein O2780_20325 [Proteobacteria bacterium]|jgi:hypothetical protein|nr:hypothetical protein [Pseudomonadota bacterium]MDA1299381.1 hypothetical protein [Pseudomonadota bacterium]